MTSKPPLSPGMRNTRQRRLVYDAVAQLNRHCTADEIGSELARRSEALPRSTVYRALEALTASGALRSVHLGDVATHYELAAEEHQHAICSRCDGVLHLEDDLLRELESHLAERHRFLPAKTQVLVVGVCASCAESEGPPRPAGKRTLDHVHYETEP